MAFPTILPKHLGQHLQDVAQSECPRLPVPDGTVDRGHDIRQHFRCTLRVIEDPATMIRYHDRSRLKPRDASFSGPIIPFKIINGIFHHLRQLFRPQWDGAAHNLHIAQTYGINVNAQGIK